MTKTALQRDLTDIGNLDTSARLAQKGLYDGVEIKCWNKAEADRLKKYMEEHYPDVKFRVSWTSWPS